MYSIKKLMFTTFNNTEDKKKPKSPTLRTHHLLYMDENLKKNTLHFPVQKLSPPSAHSPFTLK